MPQRFLLIVAIVLPLFGAVGFYFCHNLVSAVAFGVNLCSSVMNFIMWWTTYRLTTPPRRLPDTTVYVETWNEQ